MSWYHPKSLLDKVFEGSLLLKGASGVGEFLAGVLVLFISPTSIHKFLVFLTQRELSEDPHDKFAHFLLHSADSLNVANRSFLVIYLWIHASIKLIAVVGILRNWLWAYPFALISLGLLMLYQLYSIYVRASIGMILLTIFDIFVLVLIWREYSKVRGSPTPPFTAEA